MQTQEQGVKVSVAEEACDLLKGTDDYLHVICRRCHKPCKLMLTKQQRSTSGYSQDLFDVECPQCGRIARLSVP